MRFRIVQCLCPERHAILAIAISPDAKFTDAEALEALKLAVDAALAGNAEELGLGRINPWCGLCGAAATTWRYELGHSGVYEDWEDALTTLKALERSNRATAALLELLDASYDAQLRRAVADQVNEAHATDSTGLPVVPASDRQS